MTTFKEIWKTLSTVDCSKHTKKVKAGYAELTYLPWSSAWELVCNHYPDSNFEVLEDKAYGDTLEVWVRLTICGHSRLMWLPVMDNKNRSIPNPTSREVSDNRMRCLVKAAAMFGLGLYIYQGEELPKPTHDKPELTPTSERWKGAVEHYRKNNNIAEIKKLVHLSHENELELIYQASQGEK